MHVKKCAITLSYKPLNFIYIFRPVSEQIINHQFFRKTLTPRISENEASTNLRLYSKLWFFLCRITPWSLSDLFTNTLYYMSKNFNERVFRHINFDWNSINIQSDDLDIDPSYKYIFFNSIEKFFIWKQFDYLVCLVVMLSVTWMWILLCYSVASFSKYILFLLFQLWRTLYHLVVTYQRVFVIRTEPMYRFTLDWRDNGFYRVCEVTKCLKQF